MADPRQPESDALVIFGVTGDLAYKKVIPSVYKLALRGRLPGPVLGVAREEWTLQRLRERVSASVRAHESGVDEAALAALCGRLRIVGGDYRDPGTFRGLREALGDASAPLH
jgi:glucose-6-phosphate 1-dehydrogenase